MYLQMLTDEELLRVARIELNDLVSTELERELIRRLEQRADEALARAPLDKVLDDHGIEKPEELQRALEALGNCDPKVAGALLDVLTDLDIDDPDVLRAALKRDAKFTDLMNDLAAPLASLQALATTE